MRVHVGIDALFDGPGFDAVLHGTWGDSAPLLGDENGILMFIIDLGIGTSLQPFLQGTGCMAALDAQRYLETLA